jgi:signal transduction histidine kinase
MPIELSGMYTAVETGQVRCLQAESNNGNGAFALLKKARSQVVIPIRREVKVIGLMVLESLQAEACPEDVLAFLSRLSDHAAIAIANAQLYARIEAANRSKAEFVRFVAHELKNPMSPIKGFTEMILTGMAGPVNEMQASFLKTVRSNVNRIETIVQDLEDAAKIEGGRLALNFKPVQISEVIETIVRSMTQQIEEKQQRLVVNVPEDLPDVWADQTRLEQVLTNLVSNAYKYTPQGGQILLEAELTMSDPDKPDSIRVVHLWVKDSGIGISEEDQKKIFSQYFRTMISREIAQGTGLGLNITKSLVEMQGGRIWFESELQKGTTFHFTVPVAETA